jgi:hypothetical protein
MNRYFYISNAGDVQGPCTGKEINDAREWGHIPADTLVAPEIAGGGHGEWKPLREWAAELKAKPQMTTPKVTDPPVFAKDEYSAQTGEAVAWLMFWGAACMTAGGGLILIFGLFFSIAVGDVANLDKLNLRSFGATVGSALFVSGVVMVCTQILRKTLEKMATGQIEPQ